MTPKDFIDSHSENISVYPGHPFQGPVFRILSQKPINLFPVFFYSLNYTSSEIIQVFIGAIMGKEKRKGNFCGLVGEVNLIENL